MALLCPVVAMKSHYTHAGSGKKLSREHSTPEMVNEYSVELQLTKDTPPTFIVHSQDNEPVPVENSVRLFQAHRDKHVPTKINICPSGGHGFSMALEQGRLSG